jgi:hypothetical protein
MAYDPNGWKINRDLGLQRLAALAQGRQAFADAEYRKQKEKEQELLEKEKEQALDNSRGAFGMAGMGASIGSMFPGVGTAVGAGAGFLLGGLAEAKNRQRIQGGDFWSMKNLGKSFLRAPSMQELPAMAGGAVAGAGAIMKAKAAANAAQMGIAASNQYFKDARIAHDSGAAFQKRLDFQPTDLGRFGANSTPTQIEQMYPGAYGSQQPQQTAFSSGASMNGSVNEYGIPLRFLPR